MELHALSPVRDHLAVGVLYRRTRPIVAYARLLWGHIPLTGRRGSLDTDPLERDHKVLPSDQHHARYPKWNPTNPIERFNNTLCQHPITRLRQHAGQRSGKGIECRQRCRFAQK